MSLKAFINATIVSPEVLALFTRYETRDQLAFSDIEILFNEIERLRARILNAHILLTHLHRTETYPSCCFNDFSDKVRAWLDSK